MGSLFEDPPFAPARGTGLGPHPDRRRGPGRRTHLHRTPAGAAVLAAFGAHLPAWNTKVRWVKRLPDLDPAIAAFDAALDVHFDAMFERES